MSPVPVRVNPFPGLRPFTQDEDHLFFGREEQTMELLQRLGSRRFLAVVGTSGSGKSSLVRCGLLSQLLGGKLLGAGASWEVAVTHPGGNPLALLTDALLDAGLYDREREHARENLLATLSRSHFGLVEAVRQTGLGARTNFLLVVDQFEEVFRFRDAGQNQEDAANEFIGLLLQAVAQTDVPIYVVLTMRSDFIGECGQFEGLAEHVNRGEFLIPRLTREQYKRVIEGPIKVAGGQIAPRLLQRLLNDLGQEADQLPCLQHALMRTWDLWAARGETEALDLDDYHRAGRMSQALSLHADEVYASLASDRQRALCEGMFQALTVEEANSRGIRRPQRLGQLCRILEAPAAELVPVIDAYRQHGVTFVMPSPEVVLTEQTIIDISHESLMRVWTRLRRLVDEETQAAGIYRRLAESAALQAQGQAGWYRDPELGIALAWRESKRPNAAWADRYRPGFAAAMAFLDASRDAAEREEAAREAARQRELEQARQLAATQARVARQFKRFAVGLAAGLVVTVGLTIWALLLRQEAIRQGDEATRQQAVANEQRQIAEREQQRAEVSAADARRQQATAEEQSALAEEQRGLAQSRLGDVSTLANAMIFEIGDGLRDLSGTTATRESMVRRGVEYLNRMSVQNPGGSAMQRQMAAGWLKVAELQYDPGRASLYDSAGARASLARALTLLEPLAKAHPNDAELRHHLIQAYRQRAQLQRTEAGRQADLSRGLQLAERGVADQPASLRAQADLADVYDAQREYQRAVEIRERVMAADPEAGGARWRLYSSQASLGASTGDRDREKALTLLEAALGGLEALGREDPTNAQYQRDRAMLLITLTNASMRANRSSEAVERARQAVALMTPLAAADPRNAGFQVDLNRARRALGSVLVRVGQNAEAQEFYQQALSAQEAEVTRYPENADFAVLAASIHSEIAANFSALQGPQAILNHRRAAESVYRRLVQEYPDRKEYARSLVESLQSLASGVGAAGDRTAAMGYYTEALQVAEKLVLAADASDEDWMARAAAHRGLATGAQALGRAQDAIAENLLGIADYEKVLARNPQSESAQASLAVAWRALSALYAGRREYREAVDAQLKAMPFYESEQARLGPATPVLWNPLNELARHYVGLGNHDRAIETGRRYVEIALNRAAALPESTDAAWSVAASYNNLAILYTNAGRRDEGVASYRQMVEALDKLPMEQMETPTLRRQWSNIYGAAINNLYVNGELDGLAALSRRVIAVVEPLYQAEPGNDIYRRELYRAYGGAQVVVRDLGQIGETLQLAQKAVALLFLAPVKDAVYWADLARDHAQIGSYQMSLGQSGEARASWSTALDEFRRSGEEASKALAANSGNLAALASLLSAARYAAVVSELTGNRDEALRLAKDATASANARREAAPPGSAADRELRSVRATAVRLQWLVSGEQGDYRALLDGDSTPGQIRSQVALGWATWADSLAMLDYLLPVRIDAARTAVDLYRGIGDATPTVQAERSWAFWVLGKALLRQSSSAGTAERAGQLQEAAQLFTEARDILVALDRAGTLPASQRPGLTSTSQDLATVNSKLAALRPPR